MSATRLLVLVLAATLASCSEDPGPPLAVDAGPAKPRALARLTLAQGKVELERGGQPARIADIEDLFDQDLIITGEGARAVLKFKDGGELELAPSSRFRITQSSAKVDVDLQTGIISLLEGDGVKVITPLGRTNLPDDSKARLDKGQDALTLELLVGEITLLEEDGGAVQVKAGQKLKFQVGAVSVIEESDPSGPSTPLPVVWMPVAGTAELKTKGEKRFKPAKARVELQEGTAFKLPGGARARLEAPGVNAQLGRGAVGTVERAGQKGSRRQVEVSLDSGLMELTFVGDGQNELIIPSGGAVAKVRGGQRAQVRVQGTGKGSRLVVVTGEVEIASGDGAGKTVKAGESAVVDSAKVEVSPLRKPALLLPTGKRVRVYGVGNQEVGLDLPDDQVEVEVATDAAFKELLMRGTARGFVSLFDPPAQVFWRALDGKGQELVAGKASFNRDRRETRSAPTSDTVPEQKDLVTFNFQGEPPALTLTWEATEGAASYRLRIWQKSVSKAVVDKKVDALKATIEAGTLKELEYSWLATPLDKTGKELKRALGDEPARLILAFDNSFTGLAILGPQPSEKATPKTRAKGVAPLGSKLFINGAAVPLDGKGRYDFEVGRSSPLIFRSVSGEAEDFWIRSTR